MEEDDRLPAIVDYLKMHPTPPPPGADGQQIHIHHHYAPPAPLSPPPKPTVAEQLVPWLYFALMACIVGTICAFILTVVAMILLVLLLGIAVVAAVLAYLIKTARESQINSDLSHAAAEKLRRSR